MKRLAWILFALALCGAVTLSAQAGPKLSLGVASYQSETYIAPGFGFQWYSDLVGLPLEFNLYLTRLAWTGGEEWSITTSSLWEFGIKAPIAKGFYGEAGLAVYGNLAWTPDALTIVLQQPGLMFGVGWESPSGHGLKGVVYWNSDTIGVGLAGYIDIAGLFNPVVVP